MISWVTLYRRWREKIPEWEELREEIDELARDMVSSLAGAEGVLTPDIRVAPLGNNYFPMFKAISISYYFIPYFHVDRAKARKLLQYTVCHEFFHYLQDLWGHIRVGWRIDPQIEVFAEEYAERQSGINTTEAVSIQLELLKKMIETKLLKPEEVPSRVFGST